MTMRASSIDQALSSSPGAGETRRSVVPSEVVLAACRLARRLKSRVVVTLGFDSEEITVQLRDVVWEVRSQETAGTRFPLNDTGRAPPESVGACQQMLVLVDADWLDSAMHRQRLSELISNRSLCIIFTPSGAGDAIAAGQRSRAINRYCADLGLQVLSVRLIDPDGSGTRDGVLALAASCPDARMAELLAGGHSGLLLDDAVAQAMSDGVSPTTRARVCIVSCEFIGPTKNGGIGTAATSLAEALARNGHRVSVLFTGLLNVGSRRERTARITEWRMSYAEREIAFHVLEDEAMESLESRHHNVSRSYAAFSWLHQRHRAQAFDVIHFPEYSGHAYYTLMAKRLGVAFDLTDIVVGTHTSTRWVHAANGLSLTHVDDLVTDYLEQMSVELADAVISPSSFLLDWMQAQDWHLPERRFVQPYVRPRNSITTQARRDALSEIVFFGRLETRKGLELFCDALDCLAAEQVPQVQCVTFIGQPSQIRNHGDAPEYVRVRAQTWPWETVILTDLTQNEAIRYLESHPCLSVVPSLVDNSPNTVLELLGLQVPFVASVVGGTAELIAAPDLPDYGVDARGTHWSEPRPPSEPPNRWRPDVLARTLSAGLRETHPPARFAIDPLMNERAHVSWHAALAQRARDANGGIARVTERGIPQDLSSDGPPTKVSVCVAPDAHVDAVLAALDAQISVGFEVVVAQPQSHAACSETAGELLNAVLGRARGEWMLFLNPGIVLDPEAIARLEASLKRSPDTIITFPARSGGGGETNPVALPIGGPAELGLFGWCFGGDGYLVKRDVACDAGGFPIDARSWEEAHQSLLATLTLSGLRIMAFPCPLGTAPTQPERGRRSPDIRFTPYGNSEPIPHCILRPYLATGTRGAVDLVPIASNLWNHPAAPEPLRHNSADAGTHARGRQARTIVSRGVSWMRRPRLLSFKRRVLR